MRSGNPGFGQGLVSYVPTITAVAIIVGLGMIADYKTRQLACQIQREQAAEYLGGLKAQIEDATDLQVGQLARLTGALAVGDASLTEDLNRTATHAAALGDPVLGLAVRSIEDGALVTTGAIPDEERLGEILRDSDPEERGAKHLPGATPPSLAIWSPIYRNDPDEAPGQEAPVVGQAAFVIDSEKLFVIAGLRDASSDYKITLTETPAEGGGDLRGVLLGSAGLSVDDPVMTDVRMPGGSWRLEIAPTGGWATAPRDVLPIRGLTFVSAFAVGLVLLRMRNMSEERRRNLAAIEGKDLELRDTTQRLELALTGSQIGVFDYNSRTGELDWDDTNRAHFDTPPEVRVTYDYWASLLHPEDRAVMETKVREAVETQRPVNGGFRIIDRSGRVRYIQVAAAGIPEPDGTVHVVGLNWDVTATQERTLELERRQKVIDEEAEVRARLFATMSHEIRTPLGGILGVLDLMRDGPLSTEQRIRANLVRSSASQLLCIVNDCLDLARLQAEQTPFNPEPVDIRELAEEVMSLLSAASDADRVTFSRSATDRVPARIVCDPVRLRQVLNNIVGNAVRYTDAGTVSLALDYDHTGEGSLRLRVSDTGIGIAQDDLPMIFGRFARAGDANARGRGGSGLGLAICKEIVDRMGGEISVSSTLGEGTTFDLRIPAAPAGPWAVAKSANGFRPHALQAEKNGEACDIVGGDTCPGEDAPDAPRVRILVAAAPGASQRLLSDYFVQHRYAPRYVRTGADAVDFALSGAADLVILDLDQPLIDALAIARRIRLSGERAGDLPIIVLAGALPDEQDQACRAARIDAILAKPVCLDALDAAVKRAVGAEAGRFRKTGPLDVSLASATVSDDSLNRGVAHST